MKTVERLLPGWRIGTTSYIFTETSMPRQSYEENIALLGPHVSFIQLLLLGKGYLDIWFDDAWIDRLRVWKTRLGIDLVVHLPLDIHLWPETEEEDVRFLDRLLRQLAPLDASSYVLHLDMGDGRHALPYEPREGDRGAFRRLLDRLARWQEYPLLFENTGWDLLFFAREIEESPFGVCFDVGHWWLQGGDERVFCDRLGEKIRLVHLHGVSHGRDHLSLSVLPEWQLRRALSVVRYFPLVIEVFSLKDLVSSLVMMKISTGKGGEDEREHSARG